MARRRVAVPLDVDVPPQRLWLAVTDWVGQSRWMLGTRVWVAAGDGRSVGSEVAAFTGIGRLGFLDTMTVTAWDPPGRCDVVHTGRVVRGTGAFVVQPRPDGASRFIWSEELELPLGVLGVIGWPVVRPLLVAGVRHSLRRLAASLTRG